MEQPGALEPSVAGRRRRIGGHPTGGASVQLECNKSQLGGDDVCLTSRERPARGVEDLVYRGGGGARAGTDWEDYLDIITSETKFTFCMPCPYCCACNETMSMHGQSTKIEPTASTSYQEE
jgi:hypothetical protein